jgi:hypothetical protein
VHQDRRRKRVATLLIDKSHQRHHPTSEYHDTQHHLEYVTIHGGLPCVLPTMHSAFHMDKADNTLVRPGVQGQMYHIPVVIHCV